MRANAIRNIVLLPTEVGKHFLDLGKAKYIAHSHMHTRVIFRGFRTINERVRIIIDAIHSNYLSYIYFFTCKYFVK